MSIRDRFNPGDLYSGNREVSNFLRGYRPTKPKLYESNDYLALIPLLASVGLYGTKKVYDKIKSRSKQKKKPEEKVGGRQGNTQVQSVLLLKKCFTLQQAKKWIKSRKFKVKRENGREVVDETKNFYRFRQRNPSDFLWLRSSGKGCMRIVFGVLR